MLKLHFSVHSSLQTKKHSIGGGGGGGGGANYSRAPQFLMAFLHTTDLFLQKN